MTTTGNALQGTILEILETKGRDVYTIAPETSAAEAIRVMNERGVGALVVVKGGRPVGIFTERDVLRRLVGEGLDPTATLVEKLMSDSLVVVGEQVSVWEAMAIITKKRSRHLPVVEKGQLVGIVSSGDLSSWLTHRQEVHIKDLTDYILGNYPV